MASPQPPILAAEDNNDLNLRTPDGTVARMEAGDNDLIIETANGALARFEASDVASNKDGNRKESKDLISLGVVPKAAPDKTRRFLVVSPEFAGRLLKRKCPVAGWKYEMIPDNQRSNAGTRVIDVTNIPTIA